MTEPRREITEINQGRPNRVVAVEAIYRFEACAKYVLAHTAAGIFMLTVSLTALEAEFSARFIRTHRAHLVERGRIKRIFRTAVSAYQVDVFGVNAGVPLSRTCRRQLLRDRPDLKPAIKGASHE